MRVTPAILVSAAISLAGYSAAAQTTLPNAPAKDVVQNSCTLCHQLNVIMNAGHTPEEWARIVGDMINKGAQVAPAQASVVTQYLASNFPPRARAQAPVLTGNVQANIREFAIPSRPFPHDPLAAADGSVWYSGMAGNVLGR